MDDSRCAFCELSHPRDRLRRDFELDVCDACACGQAEWALKQRGHTIDIRRWETEHRHDNRTETVYHMELTAHAPGDFVVTATFTREGWLARLTKLFRREIQVGDPLFDDFVYISTEDREQTTALLRSSGAQSTLMDLISCFDRVTFENGTFVLYQRSDGHITIDAAAMLSVCALLVHVERSHSHQS